MTCAPVHRTRPDGPFHPDVAVAGRAGGAEPDVDGAEVDVEPVEGAGVREPVDGSDGIDEPVDDGGGLLVDGRVLDGGGVLDGGVDVVGGTVDGGVVDGGAVGRVVHGGAVDGSEVSGGSVGSQQGRGGRAGCSTHVGHHHGGQCGEDVHVVVVVVGGAGSGGHGGRSGNHSSSDAASLSTAVPSRALTGTVISRMSCPDRGSRRTGQGSSGVPVSHRSPR